MKIISVILVISALITFNSFQAMAPSPESLAELQETERTLTPWELYHLSLAPWYEIQRKSNLQKLPTEDQKTNSDKTAPQK